VGLAISVVSVTFVTSAIMRHAIPAEPPALDIQRYNIVGFLSIIPSLSETADYPLVLPYSEVRQMPIVIESKTYYRMKEACRIAGISRPTLLRWFKKGVLEDVSLRDRRGWRLFSAADLDALKTEANRVQKTGQTTGMSVGPDGSVEKRGME